MGVTNIKVLNSESPGLDRIYTKLNSSSPATHYPEFPVYRLSVILLLNMLIKKPRRAGLFYKALVIQQ
jgi:hypothetical protein